MEPKQIPMELQGTENQVKELCFSSLIIFFLVSECITQPDCPNGGTNYQCKSNLCQCLSPFYLDGIKCVAGMLLIYIDDLQL